MFQRGLSPIPLTLRPAIVGTPVWYAEVTTARTQLDIAATIPSGSARKLKVLWGTNAAPGAVSATFDPAGVAFPLIAINGAFWLNGPLYCGAWYLDTPPTGSKIIQIATENAVWSAVYLEVLQNARSGLPESAADLSLDAVVSSLQFGEDLFLLDAYSETRGLILASGLSTGNLTPDEGQDLLNEDVINASFLAVAGKRTHTNSGDVTQGWTASSAADMLQCAVNIPFSTGQIIAGTFQELSRWEFDEPIGALSFADAYGLSPIGLSVGAAEGDVDPLVFGDPGTSLSVQGTVLFGESAPEWGVNSWSLYIYLQPRAWPSSGNKAVLCKDTGLPVPGGTQLEIETNGAIDWYIRDATGLQGTAIHVTATAGDGTLTLNVGHLLVCTYDDDTKTAKLYHRAAGGSVTLLAQKTDANFAGLGQNGALLSVACRSGTPGVEFDGIIDRVVFGAGVLTQAEIEALPAPVTVSDLGPPTGIIMSNINLGTLAAGSTTLVDPTLHGTGFGSPVGDLNLTQVADADNRMDFVDNNTPTARVRIVLPSPGPASPDPENAQFSVSEDGGPASNASEVSWIRQAESVGDYTPFDFVTSFDVNNDHSGVSRRPAYDRLDPESAAVIDPMTGLQIIRLGGNLGETLYINGTQDSGLKFPQYLRTENGAHSVWNRDSTLMMVGRSWDTSGDDADSYLIDVDGTHGASKPWRILRAADSWGLGIGNVWFWDYLPPASGGSPLRIINIQSDGRIQEYWPIGGEGHSVGELNTLMQVPGVSSAGSAHRTALKASYDGRYYMMPCRRNSDGALGGHRIDLINLTYGPFIQTPLQSNNDTARCALGISALGRYTYFNTNLGGSYNRLQIKDVVEDRVSAILPSTRTIGHVDFATVDGEEYLCGYGQGQWRMCPCAGPVNMTLDDVKAKAQTPAGVNHGSGRTYLDLMETVGPVDASTMGLRYAIWGVSTARDPKGIWGIRLGKDDFNVVRYLCNHRNIRYSNRSEMHPRPSPNARYVAFPSNWQLPGVEGLDLQNAYVVVVPDAWRSPNNDGS